MILVVLFFVFTAKGFFLPSDDVDNYLVPLPYEITYSEGFDFVDLDSIALQSNGRNSLRIEKAFERLKIQARSKCSNAMNYSAYLEINLTDTKSLSENYSISSTENLIKISSTSEVGVLRAFVTLEQLIQPLNESCTCYLRRLAIEDGPKFDYRGILLDTSRNFFPVEDILRTLDGMSRYKLNIFHWHVIDSQNFPLYWDYLNFRLPLKGAYRYSNGSLKVYTKQDVKTILDYAYDRGIEVVPEFDSPGHTTVWGNAFPDMISCPTKIYWEGTWKLINDFTQGYCNQPPCGQFNPSKDTTFKIFKRFLKDMESWFPSKFWHFGFDEINSKCWGVANSSSLIHRYFSKLNPYFNTNNKVEIFWDDIITEHNLNPSKNDSVIQVWRTGEHYSNEYLKRVTGLGYRTIFSLYEYFYLDCSSSARWCLPYKTWKTIYAANLTGGLSESEASLVMGGVAPLWSETIKRDNLDMALWPRSIVLGEMLPSSDKSNI